MKANRDKIHLVFNCNKPSTLVIHGSSIETNTKEVLLGTTIDQDLKFDDHFNRLCKNVCQKLNARALYMNVEKRRIIRKVFT